MYKKIIAGAFALLLSSTIVSCSGGVMASSKTEDYVTDTTLPLDIQLRDAGLPYATYLDNETWWYLTEDLCMLNLWNDPEELDQILIEEGFDEDWDREHRDLALHIFRENGCPAPKEES